MPQSTKSMFTVTYNPEYVIVEKRGQGGLETKVIPRDGAEASIIGDYIMSIDPKAAAPSSKA